MNSVERRKSPRIDSINLSYVCLDKNEKVLQQAMGRTLNISEGGFLLETHFEMKKSYTLIASLGLENDTVDIRGKVVHCQSLGGGKHIAGIEITAIESGDKSIWLNFIKKALNEEPDADAET